MSSGEYNSEDWGLDTESQDMTRSKTGFPWLTLASVAIISSLGAAAIYEDDLDSAGKYFELMVGVAFMSAVLFSFWASMSESKLAWFEPTLRRLVRSRPLQRVESAMLLGGIVVLALAVFDMPRGYYVFVKLAAFLIGAVMVWKFRHRLDPIHTVLFGAIVLLCNPLVEVRFPRDTWRMIDLAIACYLAVVLALLAKSPKGRSGETSGS